jgi:mutator protein MutT
MISPSIRPESIDVAAGLIVRHGRILLAQRLPGSHLAGLWEFPGGKRQTGESWEACLIRELREELGIVVEVGRLYSSVSHQYGNRIVHLRFFLCELRCGEPRALGCGALAWVDRGGLSHYVFPPADAQLLEKLRDDSAIWHCAADEGLQNPV